MNVTNHSILHVYFPNSGTEFLKQDVTTRWYEYLGKYFIFSIFQLKRTMNIFLVTITCHAVTVSRSIIVILKDIGYRIFLLQLYRLFSFLTIIIDEIICDHCKQ